MLDEGLEEPVSSVIWASFRLQADVPELKVVVDQLRKKYGKEFVEFCQRNDYEAKINEKLLHKLGVEAPPKQLVEMYMEEIAKSYNVPFTPDPGVMSVDALAVDNLLLDVDVKGGGGGGGGMAVMEPQGPPHMPPPAGFIDAQVRLSHELLTNERLKNGEMKTISVRFSRGHVLSIAFCECSSGVLPYGAVYF